MIERLANPSSEGCKTFKYEWLSDKIQFQFFEAGGLRFKSRAGQIGRCVANGSPPLRHFFERS